MVYWINKFFKNKSIYDNEVNAENKLKINTRFYIRAMHTFD